jgi:ABC-type Fe3+ transport system substrate-binding protein
VVRAYSYAPFRDLILPPPQPIVVKLLYSTEKDAWLKEVIANYQVTNPTLNGRPIQIQTTMMGSREIYLAVLNSEQKPTLISPASSFQTLILENLSVSKFGLPIVLSNDPASCRSIVKSPLVLVAWRERAEAIWGSQPPANLWMKIHDLAVDPKGWANYGHADWGYFKFGHTNPLSSNSGFMTILLMTLDYFQKTGGLTSTDILSNTGYQAWFLGLEGSISQFGESTGTYMRDIVAYGPSAYDMVTVYEATAIEQANNAVGRYGELHIYYPPSTILSDHPFCILKADWVKPEEATAAKLFVDYLLTVDAQRLALLKYGFRPALSGISLDQAGSPFQQYAENGLNISLPPEVDLPPGDVLNTLLDFWTRNIHR